MINDTIKRVARLPRANEIAGWNTDPRFYSALKTLPNPDPILRRVNAGEDVFAAISSDAHVKGELRSIRSGLLRFEHRLMPGGDDRASKKAFEICQSYLDNSRPSPNYLWLDVFWNIGKAIFQGFSVHEIVPGRYGDLLLPQKLVDRPIRRFRFEPGGEYLRVITREQMVDGVEADQSLLLIARHMPTYDQPYGEALFSSCFWPYTFKHCSGFKPFVKFCERHGLPIPVGTYPIGTPEEVVDTIELALANLVDAGYVAMPEDGSISLLETKGNTGGGKLAQETLIHLCNAEMSKVLTSQTLATEQIGGGSRAASETHRGREMDVQEGDREIIAHTLDKLWALITTWNVPNAKPPTSEFIEKSEVRKERAEIYDIAIAAGLPVSKKAMAEELAITLADPNDPTDLVQQPKPAPNPFQPSPAPDPSFSRFAREPEPFEDQQTVDAIQLDTQLQGISRELLMPLLVAFKAGVKPEEIEAQLASWYPKLDDEQLQALMARALFVADTWGRISAQAEASS